MFVVYDVAPPKAARLARRYGQRALVLVQRVPFEHLVMLDVNDEMRVELPRFEPAAITDGLVHVARAAAVAVVYRPATLYEGLAMTIAEWRLRSP